MRGLVIGAVLCACYAPSPQAGSPCVDDRDCPSAFACIAGSCGGTAPEASIDAPRVEGCTPSREICGNGIDEDCDAMDPACAANDVAAGAIDVTAGGTFPGDALLANDDVT